MHNLYALIILAAFCAMMMHITKLLKMTARTSSYQRLPLNNHHTVNPQSSGATGKLPSWQKSMKLYKMI